LEIATHLGHDRPAWAHARSRLILAVDEAVRLGSVVVDKGLNDKRFIDKSRHSMDWFYPVLGGALVGADAHALIDRRWAEFIVPVYGARSGSDRPGATPAEACELVVAWEVLGRRYEAGAILDDIEVHRGRDGGYWTGYVWPDTASWPEEKTTGTAAA